MAMREARKYITALHKKQADPINWPDFLTGLPDHAAVVRKINEVYDKLGRYCVVYFRIENIEPYLAKYGTDKHMEIIEWAAAILKTTMDKYNGFVGTIGTHEFLAICRTSCSDDFTEEAGAMFRDRVKEFYMPSDLEDGLVLSFSTDGGEHVRLGLMDLKHCIADHNCNVKKDKFLPCMKDFCC